MKTLESGTNMLSGIEPETIISCVDVVLQTSNGGDIPAGYLVKNVSSTILKLVLGFI